MRVSSGELRSMVVGDAWVAAARRGRVEMVLGGGGVSSLRVRRRRVDIVTVVLVLYMWWCGIVYEVL